MKEILLRRGRLWRFLFSLILAVLFWMYVNPESSVRLRGYPVAVEGPEEGLALLSLQPSRVDVEVFLPERKAALLQPGDLSVTADLRGLGPGTHRVPLRARPRPGLGIYRVQVSPPEIQVRLDRVVTRTVPVRVEIQGSPAYPYSAQPVQLTPLTATVRGPESLVARVTEAYARLSMEARTSDLQGEFPLSPVDDRGETVAGVEILPPRVSVWVPVRLQLGFKPVPVRPRFEGNPPLGWILTGFRVEPPLVTVAGNPDDLELLPDVPTAPIDLGTILTSTVLTVPLKLPEGVSLARGPSRVQVTLTLTPLLSTVDLYVPVSVEGLNPRLRFLPPFPQVHLTVQAPLQDLLTLSQGDFRVWVDAAGLPPGLYILPVQVEAPDWAWSVQVRPTELHLVLKPLEGE